MSGPLNRIIARLGAAGVASPRTDAELLLAHVLGVPRSRLVLAEEPTPPRRRPSRNSSPAGHRANRCST